ncbi:hypothetical protein MUK42_12109 [Musa troglodytarum]|uniref:Uncharacterized protein n=1 Tax=Musa troglodytarum TaxID=320322 RepID=A0A9E7HC22_9LILI|nr:hypothetical protein MUK42_12109 [Musa troglodytarum]URE28529.1 hypothetical protein MUK42_12109 [Musa troglodytarum]
MLQQSSSHNSHNKGSKIKTVIQISLLLAVIVWLVNHINKNAHAGGDQQNLDQGKEVDFGQKGIAGSENVIIIDGQRNDFDETSEAVDQAEAIGQHTEEKTEGESLSTELEISQDAISSSGQREKPEEQPGNKDGNDGSSTNSRDVATGNDTSNDKEDALQLPSQRDSENSLDQYEGNNLGDTSVEQSRLVPLDETKNDTEEAITSNENRFLSSENQIEGGEKTDEVERDAIDSNGGVKPETEGSCEDSCEDATNSASLDDAKISLPKEENEMSIDNDSSEKSTLDSQGDNSIDPETTEHPPSETLS